MMVPDYDSFTGKYQKNMYLSASYPERREKLFL
jgi:hypothetical protein